MDLAVSAGLQKYQVSTWFANRRQRQRKEIEKSCTMANNYTNLNFTRPEDYVKIIQNQIDELLNHQLDELSNYFTNNH
jgi:hypothetical protein